jgi:hypothetical protein
MKILYALLFALPLAAQEPAAAPKPAEPQETQAAKPEEPKPAETKAEQPAPSAEKWITGDVDFGYRWVTQGGDFNTYRSVVNLGEGPKLFGVDLTIQPPSKRLVDRIDVHAYSWGGDPYNTARIDARKEGLYQFVWDYKNIAYYNFLPSFADPTRDQRFFLNQRSFDSVRRNSDFELDLFPGHRIIPYVAYSRNGGRGTGITDFIVQPATAVNEYPVATLISDRTNLYRGGVRFEFNRFHVTLEQGGFHFGDSQEDNFGPGTSYGNVTTPILGQTQLFTNGRQAYGTVVSGIFSKALVTASPASWINLYGQFLYSQAKTTNHFTQTASGSFIDLSTLALFTGQLMVLDSLAKQPHPSGSFAAEIKPFKRFRIMESVMTDRLHDATSSLLLEQLLATGAPLTPQNLMTADLWVLNYNQQEIDLLFDISSRLTVRGGYRYVWGDSTAPAALILNLTQGLTQEFGELRRNVALAGLTFRAAQKIRVNFDFEASPGDRSYFRTSLNDYQKGRVQASYQALKSLQLAASFFVLNNQNPDPSIRYDFLARDNSASINWTPWGGKRFSVLGEYTRSTIRSDIVYLIPDQQVNGQLATDISQYRENSNTATAMVDVPLPGKGAVLPKLSFGGSFFRSAGTRPAHYYQPLGRFVLPLGPRIQWNAEWRWYGLTQPTYLYEGFRSHQFVTGLKLTM